jgi:cytochrome c biogenesis protein CcdA
VNALSHSVWVELFAAALMPLGLTLVIRGVRLCRAAWRHPLVDQIDALPWMRGFRITIWGLALLGVGAALSWHIPWLLAVALIIGGGETLESSMNIDAIARERRLQGVHDRGRT